MSDSSYTRYTCVRLTNHKANRRVDVYPSATQTANLPHACGNAPLNPYRYDGYFTPKRYGKRLQRP